MWGLLLLPFYGFLLWISGALLADQLAGAWHSGVLVWCLVAGVVGLAVLCVQARKRR